MTDNNHAGDIDRSLRHAISYHPRPFHVGGSSSSLHHHSSHGSHHSSPHRGPVYTDGIVASPSPLHALRNNTSDDTLRALPEPRGIELRDFNTSSVASNTKGHPHGKSTSYEVANPDDEAGDPVFARNIHSIGHNGSDPPSPGFEESNNLEGQHGTVYTRENDPFMLSARLKSHDEIEQIKANTSRKRAGQSLPSHETESPSVEAGTNATTAMKAFGCIPVPTKNFMKARQLQSFYETQNENIERLLKPVDDHRREARDLLGDNQLKYKIAVTGSFAANVILAILQVYAAASSGSLSLFTTMADALFDPMSNIMLILSNRAVNRVDSRKFPSGKARIETAGNILFCFLMTTVSVVIIVQSIVELVEGSDVPTKKLNLPSVIVVAVAFCTKLSLFLYCWTLRNIYSQVRILWEDHRNDLLINGCGLLFSLGGSFLRWWLDPMGAIMLSSLIVFLWQRTAYSEFMLLIGVSADTQMLQLITYISMTHSPLDIKAIDTVRSYHSGPRLIVEVDIVMDPGASLRHTHDTAEALQIKLESLPNVERAYVHVDFETDHAPEHFLKKEL